jgi:hypothetical protein
MNSITVLCPKLSCRAILRVPENARGQRVRCGNCGNAFIVPQKKAKDTPSQLPSKPQA